VSIATATDEPVFFRLGLSFYGNSISDPGLLTGPRETMLREAVAALAPTAPIQELVEYVKAQQTLSYPDGAGAMPEKAISGLFVRAGVSGSGVVIVVSTPRTALK
jgi:hypothetical protein